MTTHPRRSGRLDDVATVATEVWGMIFGFLMHTRPQRDAALGKFGLTPGEVKALYSLQEREGHTLKELAQLWGCDASTATWTVDRLEEKALAERKPHPRDRRAKLVALTAQGAKTRAALQEAFTTPPPELLALDVADLRTLRDLLAKLPAEPPNHIHLD